MGLVCNPASVFPDFRHDADIFFEHPEINLTALFGPQHGIRGDVQYNMIETPHVRDPRTGLMVYSLYSETRVPTEEMCLEIDTFVVDLQDVGCRIYTYTYTMAYCMMSAAKYGKRVVVCDRPNPINGVTVHLDHFQIAADSEMLVEQFRHLPDRHSRTRRKLELSDE